MELLLSGRYPETVGNPAPTVVKHFFTDIFWKPGRTCGEANKLAYLSQLSGSGDGHGS